MTLAPERQPQPQPDAEREPERSDAVERLGQAFKGAMGAVRRVRGRETHHPGSVSLAHAGLLFALCDGDPRSARELAVAADLAPATVTEMLDGLAAAGLVARVRSEHDKRVVLTSLTERGHELVEAHRGIWELRWREALADFRAEELLTAAAVFDRIRLMFDDAAADAPRLKAG
jgi:DNA-binding MarR family transcriptional regulator